MTDDVIYQPDPMNPGELLKYNSGHWFRSVDAGKNYSYSEDMQDEIATRALASESILISDGLNLEAWNKADEDEKDYLKDQKRSVWERHTFNVNDPMSLICEYEKRLDEDIENAVKTLNTEWLLRGIRMLLRDHLDKNPDFNPSIYIENIKNKVDEKAEFLGNMFTTYQTVFKNSNANTIKRQITETLTEFNLANLSKPASTASSQVFKGDGVEFGSLTELFANSTEIPHLINILRVVPQKNRKSVIDDNGNWIGRRGSISILIAWVEVLQERAKFKKTLTSPEMATLLNGYFPGLKLDTNDASIWRKITGIRNSYHAEFFQHIK